MNHTPEKDSSDGGGLSNPPLSANSIEYVKQYIDASAESADRARFVLLVMVTASVLAFVAIWNSRTESWLNSRLAVTTNALMFYDSGDPEKRKFLRSEEAIQRDVWPRFFSQEVYDGIPEQKDKDAYRAAREAAFKSAKKYVELNLTKQSRFADLEHLRRYVEYVERTRTEKLLTITVPFFGIVFDINDLGMFAGLTFVIVLLLFRFSRLRELRNVRLVFQQARTVEHRELCYNLLAMQQVLTMPPQLDQEESDERRWALANWRELAWLIAPKLLALLPLLAHLRIFIHDLRTFDPVAAVYPGTEVGLVLSGVFLALNVLLTVVCVRLGWEVEATWNKQARYIIEHRARPAEAR